MDNPHAHIRAYGSLAQEVMDAGLGGVVAMRYSVYVVTAAQFVANLYAMLVHGCSLGEAVTLGAQNSWRTNPIARSLSSDGHCRIGACRLSMRLRHCAAAH